MRLSPLLLLALVLSFAPRAAFGPAFAINELGTRAQGMGGAFTAIAESMSHRYILRYEPRGVERDGWHRIDIKLRGRKGDLQARPGYWVAPSPDASPR